MEITVVLLVLVLFAGLVLPNLPNLRRSQLERASYGQVLDLVQEARIGAINDNATYAITWDSGTSSFDIKKEPPTPDQTSTSMAQPESRPLQSATSINSFEQVKAFALPTPLQASNFRIGSSTSDGGTFALHFYPDGTSDGGAFEIGQGTNVKSITVDKFGLPKLADGPLPDPTDQVWEAGTYAQRT